MNRENFDQVNNSGLETGFKLNSDSFRSFTPKGIRILEHSGTASESMEIDAGTLILGTRDYTEGGSYDPVYSIRDFAIWLHQQDRDSTIARLLCVQGEICFED